MLNKYRSNIKIEHKENTFENTRSIDVELVFNSRYLIARPFLETYKENINIFFNKSEKSLTISGSFFEKIKLEFKDLEELVEVPKLIILKTNDSKVFVPLPAYSYCWLFDKPYFSKDIYIFKEGLFDINLPLKKPIRFDASKFLVYDIKAAVS